MVWRFARPSDQRSKNSGDPSTTRNVHIHSGIEETVNDLTSSIPKKSGSSDEQNPATCRDIGRHASLVPPTAMLVPGIIDL
jgi:hypothetical protein